jgi:signal transduction histidine kinase
MSKDRMETHSIPIDQWPDPVCYYDSGNREPVVHAVNGAFEQELGAILQGESLSDALCELGFSDAFDSATLEQLCSDNAQPIRQRAVRENSGEPKQYLVRSIPSREDSCGYLVFTDVSQATAGADVSDPIDLNHVASVVSHDLRNPLDVAKAHLRAGRDQGDTEHLEQVARSHERMERIIQDVLTLARGSDVVDPDETVDLGAIAKSAWESVETSDAKLVVEDPLPKALADSDRVERLFENLFRNAIEHGSKPTPDCDSPQEESDAHSDLTVTIGRLETESQNGFFVADDGPGIPADRQHAVFEPGHSSDDHGTGLGLSIVARIVSLHDWSITATTSPAGGAQFDISGVESP